MKIAHLSDIHYCPKHLKWVHKAMVAAVDGAIEQRCHAAIISGDSFDKSLPLNDPSVSAYFEQVLRLAEYMPVAVLAGTLSHDPVGCLDILKHAKAMHSILVIDKPGVWSLTLDGWAEGFSVDGDLLLCGLPSLNKADHGIMETGPRAYVEGVMKWFSVETEKAQWAGIPTVLTTHGEVLGSVTESNYAMVSPDHEFTEDLLFSSGADAIMIGHIHAYQTFTNERGQMIAYPGSLARLVHGDHAAKGWLLWNMRGNLAGHEFIESPTRNLIEVAFDGPPDIAELMELAQDVGPDDAVRIRWVIDQEFSGTIDRKSIAALFDGAETVKLEQSILPIQSVRSEEMLNATSLEDKLKVWLESTGDAEAFEAAAMRLAACQTKDIAEIVKGVV